MVRDFYFMTMHMKPGGLKTNFFLNFITSCAQNLCPKILCSKFGVSNSKIQRCASFMNVYRGNSIASINKKGYFLSKHIYSWHTKTIFTNIKFRDESFKFLKVSHSYIKFHEFASGNALNILLLTCPKAFTLLYWACNCF